VPNPKKAKNGLKSLFLASSSLKLCYYRTINVRLWNSYKHWLQYCRTSRNTSRPAPAKSIKNFFSGGDIFIWCYS